MLAMIARAGAPLCGSVRIPGDKSISHRALMLGASAVGETRIAGLLGADDVRATADALDALGARIDREADGTVRVHGRGTGGLAEPSRVLDLGNSGTGVRLLMGLVATHPFLTFFSGDASLSRRPMRRVITPLLAMGAQFWARDDELLPLAMRGADEPLPIEYTLPVASAQVKSAILLAGLNAPGVTTVIEPAPTRDHTERLLRHFGAELTVDDLAGGGRRISLTGQPELTGRPVTVPGDPSSAAFPLVAALLVPGSRVTLQGVGLNPLRGGLFTTLREMGARITETGAGDEGGEPMGDLVVEASDLVATHVPAVRVPSMIDEFPILAVAAAFARGTTRMEGLSELRVKESDRLAAIARGLAACGVAVEAGHDWLAVTGTGAPPAGGAEIMAEFDHRIAMAFLVLGLAARAPVTIDDGSAIATSFPEFATLMRGLGASIGPATAGG